MYIKVKVTAKARKELVKRVNEDTFLLSVKEPAERNMANTRVREIMAIEFGVPMAKVRIISGHHHPSKILSISTNK